MQAITNVQPQYVNTDTSRLDLKPVESPYIKGNRIAFGRDKKGKQGGNFGKSKKMQSNWPLIKMDLPTSGINKCIGFYEQVELNEAIVYVWNSLGQFTIIVLYGDTLTSDVVYQKSNLNFSIDPRNFIAEHRSYIRLIYDIYNDEQRHVREKILVFTDGNQWQRWINMLSSIATKSFDDTLFPYYTLKGPHFDADELIDYAVRPPMFCPVVTPIARTADDKNKQNLMLGQSVQFAYRYLLTDGRGTTLSPWSNPVFIKKISCSSSKNLPRSVDLALYAGSAHVERLQVLVKIGTGDWMLYDTIDKFDSEGPNAPEIIGDQYWLRTNPWKNFNYDSGNNLIHYIYSGDKEVTAFSKDDALDLQNDVPIRSVALTAAGDSLLWHNNLFYYNNLPTETTKQFKIEVQQPDDSGTCQPKTVKISVYAYLREGVVSNQVIYHNGADANRKFGGMLYRSGSFDSPPASVTKLVFNNDPAVFGLTLGDKDGFIGYLAGTPYRAVSEQYTVDAAGNLTKVGVLDSANSSQMAMLVNLYRNRGYVVQKFDFVVPAGRYVFRIAGHGATQQDDYTRTSTYVQGVINRRVIADAKTQFAMADDRKEIAIDATAGDVDLWNNNVSNTVCVFTPFTNTDSNWRFVDGYFTQSADSKVGMEIVRYRPRLGQNSLKISGTYTDHNGFFFAYSSRSRANEGEVIFSFFANCVYQDERLHTNINKNGQSGYFGNQNVNWADNNGGNIGDSNLFRVRGKVVNCDTGAGIASVGITPARSATFYTDSDGNFEAYVHETEVGMRDEPLYINSGGDCLFVSCDCTSIATVDFHSGNPPCGNGLKVINIPSVTLKTVAIDSRGAKTGGRYGIGGTFWDLAGRATFVQNFFYADIPTFMETGVFKPSIIKWSLQGKLNLPSHVKYFTFFRTANLNAQTYLQWVGDKIDFIDNKGNTVEDGNGAIRAKITIQSLLDFNVLNNFNTNVKYQFVQGDILRVMDNGEGTLFNPVDNDGFMDYDILGTDYNQSVEALTAANVAAATQTTTVTTTGDTTSTAVTTVSANATNDGKSFIIEFDDRLLKLKDKTGFWVEIIRPKDISAVESYCEIVGTVPVIDGEPTMTEGVLDFFDTYYQQRPIVIPNALGKTMSHPFESTAVSDYSAFGSSSSCGRNNVKDPQAKQTWYANETMKTDEIVNEGRVNGLGRCRTVNKKNFKGQDFGGIVAAHAERNLLVFICENDWFLSDYDMNFVRVTAQGLIEATLDNNLTDPHPKEGMNFGCAYEDTATIVFYDGIATWADRYHNGIILREGNTAVDLAMVDNKGYFINKFNYMLRHNSQLSPADYLANLIELVSGVDPQTGEIHFTFRPRNGLDTAPQNFVNDEREVFYDLAETFLYNPDLKKWVTFAGYTPEFYGRLSKSKSGNELITFAAGGAWFHNSVDQTGVNNFYGIQTNHVVEAVINAEEKKVKIFQGVIVDSPEVKYFIDRVTTENEQFFSIVPLSQFKRKEQVWYAPFLCNMNTYPNRIKRVRSMLLDGGRTFGKVAVIRLVADMNTMGEYAELNSVGCQLTGSEKSNK